MKPLLTLLVLTTPLFAGTPRLSRITPPGGTRGTTVEIECTGRSLDGARTALFYDEGITTESVSGDATKVKLKLKIAENCRLGQHGFRLVTAGGLTEYVRFHVGPFPTINETETTTNRNDKRETAMEIPLNRTVFGKIQDAADIDLYKVEAKKGQRLSAEIESARLGVERGVPDLSLAILDAEGKSLAAADDSSLFVQDPHLSIVPKTDGVYYIQVRHGLFNGNGESYRLHVGAFSRPTAIFPAGGQAGQDLNVTILGDPMGPRSEMVKLPAKPGDFDYCGTLHSVTTPTPNRLRVSSFANVLEGGSTATLPAAFNGIIAKPGEVDTFTFTAKKGESFTFRTFAASLGTPCDPAISIRSTKSKSLIAKGSDSRSNQLGLPPAGGMIRDTHDPVVDFTAPADGEYTLSVEDERGDGGADFVYRVEAAPPENAVYTYIVSEPENQFQPQARQTIIVAAGNQYTCQVALFSTLRPYSGELELVGVNMPEGVTLTAPKLNPGMTKVPVVFTAAAGTKPFAGLVDLAVRPVKGGELASGYRQNIAMNAYGNNDYYLYTPISKLALAVTEPAHFHVTVEDPKSALVQNGEMALRFRVDRASGYDGPVTVQMDYKPNGISTATPVTVPAGQTEGVYVLGAARNAAAGSYKLALTASSGPARRGYGDGESRTITSSPPFTLTIAEPHVEAKIPRSSIERGKSATLTCKLNHLQFFEGKATVTVARLPRGVELVETTKTISAADKEVSFTLRATSEALVGNYQGLVLDITVIDKGVAVRQLSGSGTLRVDTERK